MADNFANWGTKCLNFEGRLSLLRVGSRVLINQCDSEPRAFLGSASSVGLSLAVLFNPFFF